MFLPARRSRCQRPAMIRDVGLPRPYRSQNRGDPRATERRAPDCGDRNLQADDSNGWEIIRVRDSGDFRPPRRGGVGVTR